MADRLLPAMMRRSTTGPQGLITIGEWRDETPFVHWFARISIGLFTESKRGIVRRCAESPGHLLERSQHGPHRGCC